MQDVTVARLQSTIVKTPLSFKRNVLRSKYSIRNTKEKEVVGILCTLYVSLVTSIQAPS
jgi:hypothetical protein